MEATEWIWMNGEFVRWDDAKLHFLTHTLHYGSGVFEGIRLYKTEEGPAIFRLHDHMDRFYYSMTALKMEPKFDQRTVEQATVDLVKRNKLPQGYIRPVCYFGYGIMGLNPRELPGEIGIACWPWPSYLPHEMVDIKISKYIRIHPDSLVSDAKVCGHYVNSILASLEVRDTEYHEALFLDYRGLVAEGPGENFFLVKDGVLKTPRPGCILRGYTRDTIMDLAKREGITVEECDLRPEDALSADEAFFTGTAAEVAPIKSIDGKKLGNGEVGPITAQLKSLYLDTVYGRLPDTKHYLTYVDM